MISTASTLYSQTQVLIGTDTNVCFEKSKAKYLLTSKIKLNETTQLLNIAVKRIDTLNFAYEKLKKANEEQKQTINNNDEQALISQHKLDECENEKEAIKQDSKSKINVQKTQKWLAIVIGGATVVVETYFLIKSKIP